MSTKQYLCDPPVGEEIVISGMAGVLPESSNIRHFRDNLYNKINMITNDDRRWSSNHPEIPNYSGKIFDIEKFDAGYFGVHYRQAHAMDPQLRVLFERAVEAIIDAGLHPKELEDTKTGVFIGSCYSESEVTWFLERLFPQYYQITGIARSMLANRISYALKLTGPSYNIDVACSSGAFALEHAFRSLRNGHCENAIVGGVNLCLHPYVSLQFKRLGILSMDGKCKVFDERADGYARSEAAVVLFLQKSKNSKRIYAKIIHSKINTDGYKPQSVTFPSAKGQGELLQEVYDEAQLTPDCLCYLEAHGTGTSVGDPEELEAINNVFCKQRQQQLLVGSVKSNIGHSEPVSGLASIVKVLAGAEIDVILPNVNFETPRKGAKALETNKLKVVTEVTRLPETERIIGVNSFGFGGANCHTILDCTKQINRKPENDRLPRLICVSGRIEKSIHTILDDINLNFNPEYIALYHNIFSKNFPEHFYRGYSILTSHEEMFRSFQRYKQQNKPLHLLFTDFGDDWLKIFESLNQLPVFAEVQQKIQEILINKGMKLPKSSDDSKTSNVFLKVFGTGLVQIGLAEIFKRIKLQPATIFGCGIADFISGYFDGALTLEETILPIYYLAQLTEKCKRSEEFNIYKHELLKNLQQVLPQAKKRSQKWISPIQNPQFSAELFVQSLNSCSANHFFDYIKNDGILLEVGLGQLIDYFNHHIAYLSLKSCNNENTLVGFLKILGNLFQMGQNLDLLELYPKIQFPVSTGTPNISSLIQWYHNDDWFVTKYVEDRVTDTGDIKFHLNVKEKEWSFLMGHLIDGRYLLPATGYLYFVWVSVVQQHSFVIEDSRVVFENCRFIRALNLLEKDYLEIVVNVNVGDGHFSVSESGNLLVTGSVYLVDHTDEELTLPIITVKKNETTMLNQKDFYKELRLRGYQYRDNFKKVQEISLDAQYGSIEWDQNWICFMDNMLQLSIMQHDTRYLYVPIGIRRIVIDAPKHLQIMKSINEEKINAPVYYLPEGQLIKSGGIEISGLNAMSIPTRRQRGLPVLERYEFVPNYSQKLTIHEAIRVNLQLILENLPAVCVKTVELIDEATIEESEIISSIILEVLGDLPMVSPNITILSKNPIEINGVTVEDKLLPSEADCHLVVGSKLLQRKPILDKCLTAIKATGFILSRETCEFTADLEDFEVLTSFRQDNETLILLRKKMELKQPTIIEIEEDENQFQWLPKLQESLSRNEEVILVAQNESTNGILGLTNCLRREPSGTSVRCFFIVDSENPKFDLDDPFYKEQFAKNLAINVLKGSQWGTYRHFLLDANRSVEKQHCFCNNLTRGDLTTLRWLEGPLWHECKPEDGTELVYVYYSGLNFRDVMLATGKINADVVSTDRTQQQCVQGFEFVGRTLDGRRVVGSIMSGAMSTMVLADKNLILTVPDDWSMEDAATVSVVYETVVWALLRVGQIQRKQTILIHAGAGGIGFAAISVALYFGCKVFTTVGSEEKREFIKKRFPQIKDHHIGNSRDTTFEQMIHKQTKGRGVDFVLNSLADEKLMASVRCLARGGKFLEIGKFDLANDTRLQLLLLKKEASFHGIMLDALFNAPPKFKLEFIKFMQQCIESKIIQPLPRTIFKMSEIEEAYRYLATGKHIGKVLIQIREEEKNDKHAVPIPTMNKCLPRYLCDPEKVYIIIGGLGGFGLELTDWLILRGARKLVLTSRNGIKTGYQAYRIKLWKSYCATIRISTADITIKEGCESLFEDAKNLGPIEAIFNLAVILQDCLLENQNVEKFQTSFGPKAVATKHLDETSRRLCPNLRDFVVFSSVSCGRGNGGQTNYGMANSVMERICERRRKDGLSGLAIQWGAVGDVGLVADMQENHMELEIGGTLQQKITNCLQVLDTLLTQPHPIVASMIVAEKRRGGHSGATMVEVVANIIGISNVNTVSRHATLPELGMDSMSAVEIKQTLERDFDVFLSPNDLRTLTFAQLEELQEDKSANQDTDLKAFQLLLGRIGEEAMAKEPIISLPSKITNDCQRKKVILFPGLEGSAEYLTKLTQNLEIQAKCLQYSYEKLEGSFTEMAQSYLPLIKTLVNRDEKFAFIAHSYGTIIALEVASFLEEEGWHGQLILIDGSPELLTSMLRKSVDVDNDAILQTFIVCQLMNVYYSREIVDQNQEKLLKCSSLEERMVIFEAVSPKEITHSTAYLKQLLRAFYNRLKVLSNYKPAFKKIAAEVKLMRPTEKTFKDSKEDLGLAELCEKEISIETYEGNHVTILENQQMAESINKQLLERENDS